jgi:hypothetical protein
VGEICADKIFQWRGKTGQSREQRNSQLIFNLLNTPILQKMDSSDCFPSTHTPHSTSCTFFPLLPSNTLFSLHFPTSESRHHFLFCCTLSPQVLRNFLCHIPPCYSGFFNSLPSFLVVRVFVPFTEFYIHPYSFCSQSFHFFTDIPVPLVVFVLLLLLRVLFFLPSYFHFSSLFLFPLLNTIIFVFSTFTSNFSFLAYFPRLLIISFISLSLFANITWQTPGSKLSPFSPACGFLNISSISATDIVNSILSLKIDTYSLLPVFFGSFLLSSPLHTPFISTTILSTILSVHASFCTLSLVQFPYLSLYLFYWDFCFLWRRLLLHFCFCLSLLPSSSFSTLPILAWLFPRSLIPFSFSVRLRISIPPSLFLFRLSLSPPSPPPASSFLYIAMYLLFSSRNIFLLILVLFHSLKALTVSFFNCSHFWSHHSFLFLVPFAPLPIISFFVVAFSITSFSSTTIFSTSCSSNLTFSPSCSPPLLFLFPFLHGSFFLYLFLAGDGLTLLF